MLWKYFSCPCFDTCICTVSENFSYARMVKNTSTNTPCLYNTNGTILGEDFLDTLFCICMFSLIVLYDYFVCFGRSR